MRPTQKRGLVAFALALLLHVSSCCFSFALNFPKAQAEPPATVEQDLLVHLDTGAGSGGGSNLGSSAERPTEPSAPAEPAPAALQPATPAKLTRQPAIRVPGALMASPVAKPEIAVPTEAVSDELTPDLPDPFATEGKATPAQLVKPAFKSTLLATSLGSGSRAGQGAGQGQGIGIGTTDASGSGNQAGFGGNSGAFHGSVCAIPKGTESLRSLGDCELLSEVYTDVFDIPTRRFTKGFPGVSRIEWFAILYTGSFSVSRPGVHEFALASDDGSILEIDGERVVNNDGRHGSIVRRGKVELSQGKHSLRLRYFQGPRVHIALQLWVTPPNAEKRLFGPEI